MQTRSCGFFQKPIYCRPQCSKKEDGKSPPEMDGIGMVYLHDFCGVGYEAGLYARPWDFEPGDIAKEILCALVT